MDVQFHIPNHRELEHRMHSCGYSVYHIGSPEVSSQVVDGPFGSDLKVDEYVADGVPLIRVSNCRTGQLQNDDELVFITTEKHNQIIRSEVLPGDVLLTKAGAILGYSAVFPKELVKGNITSHLASIRPTEGVNPFYLSAFLTSKFGVQQIYRWGNKSTRPELNTNEVRSIKIVLPPITKQNELVAIIDTASQQRAVKHREADELLAGMDSFVLEQLGINEIPIKSQLAVAVTLASVKTEKTIGAAYYHPERLAIIRAIENDLAVSTCKLADIVNFMRVGVSANGKPYLGLVGVVSNTGELSGVEEEAEGQSFTYDASDVLYARLRPYLNKVLYAEKSGICSTEFHVIRVTRSGVLPEYLAVIMRSKIIVSQTKHMMTGNTHPRISNDDVRNLRIPIPSMDIQHIIVKEMRNRLKRSRLLKCEAEAEWTAAKELFEQELVAGKTGAY